MLFQKKFKEKIAVSMMKIFCFYLENEIFASRIKKMNIYKIFLVEDCYYKSIFGYNEYIDTNAYPNI